MNEVRRLIPTIRETVFMKKSNRVARTSCAFQVFVKTNEIATQCSFLRAVLTIIKITIIIVFALIRLLVFAREAFGSVKTTNFVSKNLRG